MRLPQAFLLILALWATLFLPGLGDTELKGEEGRRILPAREMLRRDNFVLPYSEGRPYHRKPPGINWAIAGVFKITGVQNEWTARLPSVLAALALALTGVWAGMRLGGSSMALALGIALLVNGGMLEKARLAEIESLYVSLAGIGMLVWAVHWVRESNLWKLWACTIIPFAMANLVKGPVYLLFFYPVVILAHRKTRAWREFFSPAHFVGVVLALAPMVIWGILVKQQLADTPLPPIIDEEGNEIIARTPSEVWWQQISGRLSFANINMGDWLQLPFRVLLILAPWPVLAWLVSWKTGSGVLPAADCAEGPDKRIAVLRKSLAWGLIGSIGCFCLLPATRARYLMPALGGVTLWSVLEIFARPGLSFRWLIWDRLMLGLFVLVSVGALVVPWVILPAPWPAFLLNALFVGLAWFWRLRLKGMESPLRAFATCALPFLVLSIVLATTVLPKARLQENVRPTAEGINAVATDPGSIVAINPGPQPFLFYLGPRCAEVVKLSEYPEDVAYLLIQPKLWKNDSLTLTKLQQRGFTKIITTVKDKRFEDGSGREYLLIGRDPAAKPEGGTSNAESPP